MGNDNKYEFVEGVNTTPASFHYNAMTNMIEIEENCDNYLVQEFTIDEFADIIDELKKFQEKCKKFQIGGQTVQPCGKPEGDMGLVLPRKFNVIVAIDNKGGIAKDGKIPWHIKEDMEHFKNTTTITKDKNKMNAVIMGRKTWETLPQNFRPLPNRLNIVITREPEKYQEGSSAIFVKNFELAMASCGEDIEDVFIIGGASIYEKALTNYLEFSSQIIVSHIDKDYNCDQFFDLLDNFKGIGGINNFTTNRVSIIVYMARVH